jgi:hypothetical protein
MTVDEFIVEAKHRYITKTRILSNMFKIGFQDTEVLECRMRLANAYIIVLDRLGGDYALTDDEINAIMHHLIILLEMRDWMLPDVDDFRSITVIHDVEYVYETIKIPPVRKSYSYDVTLSPVVVGALTYTGNNTSTPVVITIAHNLNIQNATVDVVETTGGLVIYPSIAHPDLDTTTITFAIGSASAGIITISE